MSNTPNARDENGETIIPASQRPDGTWRKARRVKEGYVPQEEVPLYESKGKQFVNRVTTTKSQTVTLASGQVAHQTIPGLFVVAEKPKQKKKKKNVEEVSKQLEQVKLNDNAATKAQTKSQGKTKTKTTPIVEKIQVEDKSSSVNNQDVDPVKRLRNLKKRLREVEQLEEKLKNGLIAKPEPEQLAKVLRKNYLQMQISELEKEV